MYTDHELKLLAERGDVPLAKQFLEERQRLRNNIQLRNKALYTLMKNMSVVNFGFEGFHFQRDDAANSVTLTATSEAAAKLEQGEI